MPEEESSSPPSPPPRILPIIREVCVCRCRWGRVDGDAAMMEADAAVTDVVDDAVAMQRMLNAAFLLEGDDVFVVACLFIVAWLSS